MLHSDKVESVTRSRSTTIINKNDIDPSLNTTNLPIQVEFNKNDIENLLNTTNLPIEVENSENNDKKLIIILHIILTIILLPIIICDFYYALNDESCVKIYPEGLNITMKDYLITCSTMTIILLIISFVTSYIMLNKDLYNEKNYIIIYGTIPTLIISIFPISWHIVGATIFWQGLYQQNSCDRDVSTYLFVSLIIKIISCCNISFRKNNDK